MLFGPASGDTDALEEVIQSGLLLPRAAATSPSAELQTSANVVLTEVAKVPGLIAATISFAVYGAFTVLLFSRLGLHVRRAPEEPV